jgi:hypothetical protein
MRAKTSRDAHVANIGTMFSSPERIFIIRIIIRSHRGVINVRRADVAAKIFTNAERNMEKLLSRVHSIKDANEPNSDGLS